MRAYHEVSFPRQIACSGTLAKLPGGRQCTFLVSALITFNHSDIICEIRGTTFSERTAKGYGFIPALSVQSYVPLFLFMH